MFRRIQLPISLAVTMFVTSVACSDLYAGGKSGWGWAKPLNKRLGAFYTSNKNANFSRSSRSSRTYRRRSYRYLPQVRRRIVSPQVIRRVPTQMYPSTTTRYPVVTTPQYRVVQPVQRYQNGRIISNGQ